MLQLNPFPRKRYVIRLRRLDINQYIFACSNNARTRMLAMLDIIDQVNGRVPRTCTDVTFERYSIFKGVADEDLHFEVYAQEYCKKMHNLRRKKAELAAERVAEPA